MNDHVTHAAGHGAHPDAPPAGTNDEAGPALAPETHQPSRGHHLLMMAMCLPMLVIVAVLVTTGVAGAGAVVYALLCVVMMAAMMMLMPGHRR